MKHAKINHINIIDKYLYIIVFFIFMGVNFCKFDIYGVNMNIARILMLITSLFLIFLIKSEGLKKIFTNNKMIRRSLIFLVIWTVYSILSIVKSKDIGNYIIINFFFVAGTFTIFFACNVINSEKQIIRIFKIIEFTMIINCCYTIFLNMIKQGQIGGFYFNNNDMATVLLIAIPIEIFLLCHSKKFIEIIFRCATLMGYMYIIYILDSRANFIGLIIEIIIYVLALGIVKRGAILKSKLLTVVVIMSVITSIFFGAKVMVSTFGKIKIKPNYTYLTSNTIRVNLILDGLELMKQNPILGVGAGNIDTYLENEAPYPTKGITKLHNLYLEILVSYGIIVFIIYIIFYAAMCIKLFKRLFQNENMSDVMMDLTFLVFWGSFIISCISSSTNLTKEWLWLLVGITLGYIKIKDFNMKDEEIQKQGECKDEIKYNNSSI